MNIKPSKLDGNLHKKQMLEMLRGKVLREIQKNMKKAKIDAIHIYPNYITTEEHL